jgi:hypothetical protein
MCHDLVGELLHAEALTIRSNDEAIRLNGIGKGQGIYVTTGPELP